MADKRIRLFLAVLAAVFLLLAYAWVDGGEEPLRDIAVPLAVPGHTK